MPKEADFFNRIPKFFQISLPKKSRLVSVQDFSEYFFAVFFVFMLFSKVILMLN
jgi:hypothetical protein